MHVKSLQRHRINRVINFMRHRRAETLTLADLADVACLSRCHFARAFSDHCQEAPMEYLLRARLEQAVNNLVYHPRMQVTEVAFEAGYSSFQSFCNAFSKRYGVSPRTFRANNLWHIRDFPKNQFVLSPVLSGISIEEAPSAHQRHVVIASSPRKRLAYIRHRGPYFDLFGGRSETFAKLHGWAKHVGLWQEDTTIIGVGTNCPTITPPQYCQYDIGIVVEDGVDEDDTVSIQYLPKTMIATLEVVGGMKEVRQACRWLASVWFPTSGYRMANHACFEMYKPFQGGPGSFETGVLLCMTIAPGLDFPATDRLRTTAADVQNLASYGIELD